MDHLRPLGDLLKNKKEVNTMKSGLTLFMGYGDSINIPFQKKEQVRNNWDFV